LLRGAATEKWPSDRIWTGDLISALGRLGQERNYYVCGKHGHKYGGQDEWLYDLVWLLQSSDGVIVDVPLILESEWGVKRSEDIREDFEKLLLGRAQHRVMVFQQRSDVKRVCDRYIEKMQRFGLTQVGDRYLFVGFDYTEKVIKSKLYVA
jgi:hypothetical protein